MIETLDKAAVVAPWRIGIDVGGTFTDMVLVDRSGAPKAAKILSTPRDPAAAVMAVIERMAGELGLTCRELLQGCHHFVHASTVATNVVLERSADPVGMLVTKGFRDSIAIRRGIRSNPWAHRTPFPPVLSPRYLRLPVGGRIDRHGREREPLSEADVKAAAADFRRAHVKSIAICLYNSYLNSEHERRAGDIIKQEYPDAMITLSSRVAPIMGEYERSSTAVLNAFIAPRIISYLKRLAEELRRSGLDTPILLVQNNGGSLRIENVEERPVTLLLSGPAAAAGALSLYASAVGSSDLLSMEIGGTSCDVMLTTKAGFQATPEFELGGYHVALPSIRIHSIGAGGGTIAGVDRSGMLFAGPRGAGADPGPAAYGRGGDEPTLTDAQLVLGRLRGGKLAGDIALNIESAERSIDAKIAKRLGISVRDAAVGILKLVEQELFHAAQKITAEKGYDPRRFVLVAAGGAGPMHGASVGRKLNSAAVYVPSFAGTFCALGMLNAPIRHEFVRAVTGILHPSLIGSLREALCVLEKEVSRQLGAEGFDRHEIELKRELDLRHPGQVGTIRIEIPGDLSAGATLSLTASAFVAEHERIYGYADLAAAIEVANVRVVGIGNTPALQLGASELRRGQPAPSSQRDVYFEETSGFVTTDIYRGSEMWPGASLRGPAIVEEKTMTVVVGPRDVCTVDGFGNYFIQLQ
jgi:N-methylhydantoinase A